MAVRINYAVLKIIKINLFIKVIILTGFVVIYIMFMVS